MHRSKPYHAKMGMRHTLETFPCGGMHDAYVTALLQGGVVVHMHEYHPSLVDVRMIEHPPGQRGGQMCESDVSRHIGQHLPMPKWGDCAHG